MFVSTNFYCFSNQFYLLFIFYYFITTFTLFFKFLNIIFSCNVLDGAARTSGLKYDF